MSGIFDVALLGTSLTIGAGIEYPWARDLRTVLMSGKSSEVRFYNFGIDGAQTGQYPNVRVQAAPLKPRAFTIEYSMNDATIALATARSDTIALLDYLKANSPDSLIYLMTMNPVPPPGSSNPSADARINVPDYYQMYRDISVSEGVGLIDCYPVWISSGNDNETAIPGRIHPTTTAHRTVTVPTMAAVLSPLID